MPTLDSLSTWAERWVPEDPAMAQLDPDVITSWLALHIDLTQLPDHRVVVVFDIGGQSAKQTWLVLERGSPPSICDHDPGLALDRYVYVEADAAALYPISRGLNDWRRAVADRSVQLYGEPELVRMLPDWFGQAAASLEPPSAQASVA